MSRRTLLLIALGSVVVLSIGLVLTVSAVSGAAFTTFNAHVDGNSKDVCKNSAINCNIYGAKEYVWLNGGPTANELGPDGDYFFAVLEPGGQPNPNDDGPKNLSYNCYPGDDPGVACPDPYTNRTFTVTDGEVSAYGGTHWFDSGAPPGPKPNDLPPYIRLFPYADTTNPGGVYILAICSLDEGYPVEPRDCKYDAFKVKKGKMEYSFYLSGMKVEDKYADGYDTDDEGLEGWKIIISGTGPDGLPIYDEIYTDEDGFWEWYSDVYTFNGQDKPQDVSLTVCEELQSGWTQSFPGGDGCHSVTFPPSGFNSFDNLNFANWEPVDVTACKVRDLDGVLGGETVPVEGWPVSRTEGGVVVDTKLTEADGCYTWTGLTPGIVYDIQEDATPGWEALSSMKFVFEKAESGESYGDTFVNAALEGCTPGFWQGGNGFETAGGKWYWNTDNDPDWAGMYLQPFSWNTGFCDFFGCTGNSEDMWHFVNPDMWEVNDDFHKAARSLTAAYLNASWGIGYAYTTTELQTMWTDAYNVGDGTLMDLHTELDAANNAYYRDEPPAHCPISASIQ